MSDLSIYDFKKFLLRDLKIQKTDVIFMFSSMKYLALSKITPSQILELFEEILSKGALILPTFTFELENIDQFDSSSKNCQQMGHIAVNSIGRKGYIRTNHPIFSTNFFVNGSSKLLREILPTSNDAFGKGSIFNNLIFGSSNPKILLFSGVFEDTLYRSTFIHAAQQECFAWHRYLKIFYSKKNRDLSYSAYVR